MVGQNGQQRQLQTKHCVLVLPSILTATARVPVTSTIMLKLYILDNVAATRPAMQHPSYTQKRCDGNTKFSTKVQYSRWCLTAPVPTRPILPGIVTQTFLTCHNHAQNMVEVAHPCIKVGLARAGLHSDGP